MYEKPKQITRIRQSDPDKFADCWNIYGRNFIICSSDNPSHPQGVWSYQEVEKNEWYKWNRKLGKVSSWESLPVTLQKVLIGYFSE